MILFPANSYSFHTTILRSLYTKLWWLLLFKDVTHDFISGQLLVQFSPIKLKVIGWLDQKVEQHVLFWGYSTPNIRNVITL